MGKGCGQRERAYFDLTFSFCHIRTPRHPSSYPTESYLIISHAGHGISAQHGLQTYHLAMTYPYPRSDIAVISIPNTPPTYLNPIQPATLPFPLLPHKPAKEDCHTIVPTFSF